MSVDAKLEKFEASRLGYLPILTLTIRHTVPPAGSQSLALELIKGERTILLTYCGNSDLEIFIPVAGAY